MTIFFPEGFDMASTLSSSLDGSVRNAACDFLRKRMNRKGALFGLYPTCSCICELPNTVSVPSLTASSSSLRR